MIKYAGIKYNDVVDCAEGIVVSYWTQGCPFHCPGCHNETTWDFNGGLRDTANNIIENIIKGINAYNIQRDFAVLGGEPLCEQNRSFVATLIYEVKQKYPNIKIYLWTGYTLESLLQLDDYFINDILKRIDILIDGPFILEKKDITLPLRGSTNQRVLYRG